MLNSFTEWETKYKMRSADLQAFKALVEAQKEFIKGFFYVQGSDYYYTALESPEDFLRYRKADYDKSSRAELTIKKKTKEDNNINRMEVNVRVDFNDRETIEKFANSLDFFYNFHIWKSCHIYYLNDANLVFYTVRDDKGQTTDFIEIEVNEDLIKKGMTEEEAWEIIKRYEELLVPVGVTPQKRLRKSLFEMYKNP